MNSFPVSSWDNTTCPNPIMWGRTLVRKVAGVARSARSLRFSATAERRYGSALADCDPVPKVMHAALNGPNDYPYSFTREQEDLIVRGDPERRSEFQALMVRFFTLRQGGLELPETLSVEDVEKMLPMTLNLRKKYIKHLLKVQYVRMKEEKRKLDDKAILESLRQSRVKTENSWLNYHVFGNALFPRVTNVALTHFYDHVTMRGSEFGQNIVLDCSYEGYMDELRTKLCAKQILLSNEVNRKNRRPFALNLCNLDMDSSLAHHLMRMNPKLFRSGPIKSHSCSYLDIFDRKRLVYLTPHTHVTVEYNPDDVYIVGAFVDIRLDAPISRKKADKEKIRCAALPLSKYVHWKQGSKNICVNQCFDALLRFKNTRNWTTALTQSIPKRKLV